jgi:type II secretory pathway pseudopilin PulG
MVGVVVLGLLALVTAYLWQDWRANTREFREMRRLMMQAQEARRGGEKK